MDDAVLFAGEVDPGLLAEAEGPDHLVEAARADLLGDHDGAHVRGFDEDLGKVQDAERLVVADRGSRRP